jgi:lysophospholipase L1-like esterase
VSDNWERFSPGQNAGESYPGNKFGALINYSRIGKQSGFFGKSKVLDAWIDLKRANISFSQAQKFLQCRIFYGYNKTPMMVEVKQNKAIVDAEIVPSSIELKELQWKFSTPVRNLSISFKTEESPNIYGLALDALEGLAVDNVPLRGSAGLEFTRVDLNFLRQFYQLLNVKLLILQFGVNVVPNVIENYSSYENNFLRQIQALKKACPFLSIIIIGVSDVSRNGENGYESYPNIVKIRDAQKRVAFASGCAFWDMYEAMGGHNSMPSWVYANPALAQKDFVHLNPLGARIIGEMFYRSFIQEYEKFLASQNASNHAD